MSAQPNEPLLNSRAAYSPAEFSALCGKHPCWTYRLLYAGKVHAITNLGRILIPATELERILAPTEAYNPKPKAKKQRAKADTRKEGALEK